MKKLTKKQSKAVEYLQLDMNELMNKPRRLFSSLRKFAEVFCESEVSIPELESDIPDILDSIDVFEKMYYRNKNLPDMVREAVRDGERTLEELLSRKILGNFYNQGDDFQTGYRCGVEDSVKLLTKKNVNSIIGEQ
jgi:hypothetical protein